MKESTDQVRCVPDTCTCGAPRRHVDIFYGDHLVGYLTDCPECKELGPVYTEYDADGNIIGYDVDGQKHSLPNLGIGQILDAHNQD